ncbi:MAG: hypothetical protein V4505_25585 [Pseudomonadota bacterium]
MASSTNSTSTALSTAGGAIGTAFGPVGTVVGAGIGGLLGGFFGGDGGDTQQTTQAQLDPGARSLLYGDKTLAGGGLLPNAYNQFLLQNSMQGLNPLMNAGLESQRQVLSSPNYTRGYDQMAGLGSSLLSQPIAGNPFTAGGTAGRPASLLSGAPAPTASYSPQGSYQPFQLQNNPALDWQNAQIKQVANPIAAAPTSPPAPQASTTDAPMTPEQLLQAYIQQMNAQQLAQGGG